MRCGCDVFVLAGSLGHANTSTTAHYVAANPRHQFVTTWLNKPIPNGNAARTTFPLPSEACNLHLTFYL
ncbi:hypothetical protein [Synechococcus sp. BL107]|uniref:hypothetical protein n=1 Tax=Synechococcus sp. BL107 TaxID=313625 RepID=UPI00350F8B16